ncbi:hypothetical protein ChUKH1_07635 [Cryptosporidium hominis]|uniref:Uncharacterized protein n=1 Tax=Cryptosporidium hominis TaxID=237895 RepID=A0ABX5BI04_CRYHO|nr:hypothetical protein [Cryptosporidium hominis TU502]OLQ19422.1 hypothetical protein ChTU502y2012_400fg0040 [Cryptosporidium hominis]PPA63395.1 hypothetical protein ChUKH1_07635 [Cryptosporidium hominis]PPS98022.1 Uncharacterized protein GY17_00000988 [Cryptosporidium hominis]|eukprot:PPS98022.1 Uncharacterized protein GY17_00000988 [Cryptosporidium hominis]
MYLFIRIYLNFCNSMRLRIIAGKHFVNAQLFLKYRSSILILVLVFLAILDGSFSGEESPLDINELNRNVVFTENFFLKHIPGAIKGEEEEREGLNEIDRESDVSLIPLDDGIAPDLDSITMTRATADKKHHEDKEKGKKVMHTHDDELSLIDQDEDDDEGKSDREQEKLDDLDPGSEEQKKILKYDNEMKKKLLKLRRKHKYKDIPFGPQAPHLAMVDIFGVTGDDKADPLMEMYGLESRYDGERDLKDYEDLYKSVTSPTKFTERTIWGYDREGNPITSKKIWLEQKVEGKVITEAGDKQNRNRMDYIFPQKVYSTDGFLDEFGTFGVKSLLDKFRFKQENKFKEKKKKKSPNKVKEPEIIKKEIWNNSGRVAGPDKHIGWQVTRRAIDVAARDKMIKDLEGVEDLNGVINAMNTNNPDKQRRDAEKVFWDYYSKKKQKEHENRKQIYGVEFSIPKLSLDINFSPAKTLFGWREVLFDQAMESIGKYDPRASQRYDSLLGSDLVKGIPPSRIIADMSSEAIRRPKTHHLFPNPIKGFRNMFCKRLEKKYREYVADILQLRAEDSTYNELMDLANKYEARQDWLSQFENSWIFIPQGKAVPENIIENNEANSKAEDDYEKELLSLELDTIPASEMEIFMRQHLNGDVLFVDDSEAEDAKEAMFRKIIRKTAEYNENQPYKLPHRPRASRLLPVNDGYSPTEAIKQKESLNSKTTIVKQGKVVVDPLEKKKIRLLEKEERKRVGAGLDREEVRRDLERKIIQGSELDLSDHGASFKSRNQKLTENSSDGFGIPENEYIYKDEGRGPRNIKEPFSTNAVSSSKAPYKRNPIQKTAFDNYTTRNET